MSAVATLAATVVTAVGAVALYRFAERRSRPIRAALSEMRKNTRSGDKGAVIEYEQDPESGVFKPK